LPAVYFLNRMNAFWYKKNRSLVQQPGNQLKMLHHCLLSINLSWFLM